MTKVLFIVPYPHQQAPSQRFRFEQYESFLISKGISVEYAPYFDEKTWSLLYQKGYFFRKIYCVFAAYLKRFGLLFKLKKYDHLFIHREVAPIGPPIFEFIIAKILKRKYHYDFDDAIWLPNFSQANSRFQWFKMYWKVNYAMKWAHRISAGNEYLANYARQYNSNVVVLPTTIDTENVHNLDCNHDELIPTIGWTGSHSTMHYLDFIYPIIAELEKEFSFKFRVISDKKPNIELQSLEFIPWNKETEIEDLSKIQIGIMPLTDDQWSEGKCGFKGLQYMALGITSVMSPVGVNKTIIQNNENGFLVSTPEEWKTILTKLLREPELRKQIGFKGKETIEKRYSVNSQKQNYLNFFP